MKKPLKNNSLVTLKHLKIVIACDLAGLTLKNQLIKWLKTIPITIIDILIKTTKPVDYPQVIKKAAKQFQITNADFSILICGSGIGVAMVANRFRFWRAYRFCQTDWSGLKLAREHNNANVITFGARLLHFRTVKKAILMFLTTAFSNAIRHQKRIKLFS